MLDDLKRHRKTVGIKQTMKAVEADKVQAVYIAQDAEEHVVANLLEACGRKNIKVYKAESMKVLGKACGIDVGTAAAAIVNS